MKTVVVTGAAGFIGKNLCNALRRLEGVQVLEFTRRHKVEALDEFLGRADLVFHLAGINRPSDPNEFQTGNVTLTERLCEGLSATGRRTPVVFTSSVQAELDNAYGQSKRAAEDALLRYHSTSGAAVYIYRFTNVFGKWSRPDYNTVVATFCHNISRGLPVTVHDRNAALRFTYIDDIVREFVEIVHRTDHDSATTRYELSPVYSTTIGELHALIVSFQEQRKRGIIPKLSDPLTKYLHSTFISFLDPNTLAYPADVSCDDRGWLFELIKTQSAGQMFVSLTRPGVTRGNHYHDTKLEKFCVVQGEGIIRFRHVLSENVIEYRVSSRVIQVVDIPPGYTHSIENVGTTDMITLFWANEIFDSKRPDTFFTKVIRDSDRDS